MSALERISVMEGKLADFELASILQVVSLGRQYTAIELRRDDAAPVGTIFVKSGKVVAATAPGLRGKDAFFRLLREPFRSFHVYRTPKTPSYLPEPIGPIHKLLIEAHGRGYGDVAGPNASGVERAAPRPSVPAPGRRTAVAASGVEYAAPSVPRSPASDGGAANGASATVAGTGATSTTSSRSWPKSPSDEGSASSNASDRAESSEPTEPAQQEREVAAPVASPRGYSAASGASPAVDASQPSPRPSVPATSGSRPAGSVPRPAGGGSSITSASRLEGGGIVIAVASPKGGCGKTTIALNLGISLARQRRSVIVVDADVNGDILSMVDGRGKARFGAFDALCGVASVDDALLSTALPLLRVLPACAATLPDPATAFANRSREWQLLLGELAGKADIVIVDTPAGMYGTTYQVLTGASHVLSVLQAEILAYRSFEMFNEGIQSLPSENRPSVLGVVLNMLQASQPGSFSVLAQASEAMPREWLFDTAVPRNTAFLDASFAGTPLHFMDDTSPPAVTFLFDTLAAEVADRLGLAAPARRPTAFLL